MATAEDGAKIFEVVIEQMKRAIGEFRTIKTYPIRKTRSAKLGKRDKLLGSEPLSE